MRFEPVFLLAPKPKLPSIPTRRAFLLASGTFIAGIGLGGACGYAAGASRSGEGGAGGDDIEKVDEPLVPSGDSDLDELRRLAVKAPIEELLEKSLLFLDLMRESYPKDAVLWRGAERICTAVLSDPTIQSRRKIAGWLSMVVEKGDPQMTSTLLPYVPELRRVK